MADEKKKTHKKKEIPQVANRMKELRKKKGITQIAAAKALEIDNRSYSQYENSIREPRFHTLIKIADFYDTSIDYLLMHDTAAPERVISAKYEALDKHGKEVVERIQETMEYITEIEYRRCTGESSDKEIIKSEDYTIIKKASRSADGKPVREEKIKKEKLEEIKNLEDADENM